MFWFIWSHFCNFPDFYLKISNIYVPHIDSEHKLHQKKFDIQLSVEIKSGSSVYELTVITAAPSSASKYLTLNFVHTYFVVLE